jgi:LysM repeat protein
VLPSFKLSFKTEEKTFMARMKRDLIIVSTLMLVMIITSACNQAYSQAPAATFTPVSQSLFASPGPTDAMGPVESFATGTALAQLTTEPGVATQTSPAGITPQVATATATPLVVTNATSTATLAVAQTQQSGPTATLIPAGSRPASYTLQDGEYPYCIARRFNVDPQELLSANGLVDSQTVYAGKMLTIPQTGNPFPGNRMWHNHPDTYTVDFSSETIYGVACYYGDIDPALIAQANGLSVSASLTAGQKLTIP